MSFKYKEVWTGGKEEEFPTLSEEVRCDIIVIGGGLVGQLCAYSLTERGYNVVLIEAEKIGGGTTSKTTATITSQQGLIYGDIGKKYGLNTAKSYFEAQEEGIELYKNLIDKHKIECDYKILDGYFYTQKEDLTEFKNEIDVLKSFGAEIEILEKIESLPLNITYAVRQKGQAEFNPIMFLSMLPREYKIFENSRVVEIDLDNHIAFTEKGSVVAAKIVIATQYPIINKTSFLFAKLYQSVSYAISFKNAKDINGIYNDDVEDGITLRNYKDLLIVGGSDHRSGRKEKEDCFDRLERMAKDMYPNCKRETRWLAEDCVTYDHIPLVGKLSSGYEDIYIVSGFNKWGMSNSIISANLIADLIDGKENKYASLYSPSRGYIKHNVGDFLKGIGVASANLCKSYFGIPLGALKKLDNGNGEIFLVGGKKKAVYKDIDGKLHMISAKCPHLGCQLVFNREGQSWDCPCHGSRFDVYGNILNEPTVKSLNTNE